MTKSASAVPSLILAVICAGCSAFTPTIKNDPDVQAIPMASRYHTIEVRPVAAAPWVDVKPGDRAKIRASFIERLRDARLSARIEETVPDSAGVLALTSTLDYNERQMPTGMLGNGRGRMRIHVCLVDKTSGDTLSQADLRSKTIKGWFSRPDDRRTGQAIGARLVNYVEAVGFKAGEPAPSPAPENAH